MLRRLLRPCVGLVVLLVALSRVAAAEPVATVGEIAIHDACARASLGAMKTSAAYMTLEVIGDQGDRLIAAASPVAEAATLHAHLMDGGVARMRPLAAIEVAPGAPTVLAPGGLHIMLTGLHQRLVEGETLPLSLTFERAGTLEIEVPIRGMAGMSHGHGERQPATN
jgi:copper(I)-binding protein